MRKSRVLLYVLFCSAPLFGQVDLDIDKAAQLYTEGQAILEKENILAFDKVQAYDKFQQSIKIQDAARIKDSDTYEKTQQASFVLWQYFARYQNRDSLLQTTRFFPDSTFQEDVRYTTEMKAILIEYLTIRKRISRGTFYNLKALNYKPSIGQENKPSLLMIFDNYWPLEVREFEDWLKKKEKKFAVHSKEVRTELLLLELQNIVQTVKMQELGLNYKNNENFFTDSITKAKGAMEVVKRKYQQLTYYGLGSLGLVFLMGYYFWNKSGRLLKNNNQLLLEEKKRSEDLLTNILPAEVVRQLKNNSVVKAKKHESVSVFFSDFKNFSQIAKELSPEALVDELNICFTAFDRIIDKYRLQKIKTIGDAYMCVGGLYTRGDSHLVRMVLAALEIQQFLADRKQEKLLTNQPFFEARIGIHIGPVIAGVIGANKIAFDVWGDTVNVAQQMEQHGEVRKVNISGDIFHLIKEQFECVARGNVTTKNQKSYDMYFVEKLRI